MALARAALIVFLAFTVLVLFSKLSMSESLTGAHGKKQAESVCRAALKRAAFLAEVSDQDDSLVLALLHACEAKALVQAAKDLSEQMGAKLPNDQLALLEEEQERIEQICGELGQHVA